MCHGRQQHWQQVTQDGCLGNALQALQPLLHVLHAAVDDGVAGLQKDLENLEGGVEKQRFVFFSSELVKL